ncbi:hypothetical protein [Solimonas soli]|uniref:hypothetical protein n=1 Tax=Solimonas soli TaxID=413479 RepID=UPI0012FA1130|nr:hypothetical protein [Solimonas soli]
MPDKSITVSLPKTQLQQALTSRCLILMPSGHRTMRGRCASLKRLLDDTLHAAASRIKAARDALRAGRRPAYGDC